MCLHFLSLAPLPWSYGLLFYFYMWCMHLSSFPLLLLVLLVVLFILFVPCFCFRLYIWFATLWGLFLLVSFCTLLCWVVACSSFSFSASLFSSSSSSSSSSFAFHLFSFSSLLFLMFMFSLLSCFFYLTLSVFVCWIVAFFPLPSSSFPLLYSAYLVQFCIYVWSAGLAILGFCSFESRWWSLYSSIFLLDLFLCPFSLFSLLLLFLLLLSGFFLVFTGYLSLISVLSCSFYQRGCVFHILYMVFPSI